MTLNRRLFLQGGFIAAGAVALTGSFGLISGSAAAATPVAAKVRTGQVPGIYRTKVGAITVTSLLDGGMEMPLSLFEKAAADEAGRLQDRVYMPRGPVKAYIGGFVIDTGRKTILVDSGCGAGMGAKTGHLLENLAQAGYQPADIDEVFLTHIHPDHVGGLTEKGVPVFKNAQVRVNATELQFWYDDAMRDSAPADKKGAFAAARTALDPYKTAKRIETFKGGMDLGAGISSVDLPGHTPGHSGFRIADGKETLLIWGDIVHAPVFQFTHPDWSIAYDIDPAQAMETRRKIFAETAADRVRVAGMHLSFPAIGHVASSQAAYDFIPQSWETSL